MKDTVRHATWIAPAALLAAFLAFAGVLTGCGEPEPEPVARLTVEPERLELAYGTYADLRFRWSPRVGLEGSPRVFLHLLDSNGELVRTFDHVPGGSWRAGKELTYEARVYQSLLAPPLPPGTYDLTAGLYDGAAGERWALAAAGEEVGRREYRVATVEVPARTEGALHVPVVQFTSSWSPTLAGGDRQVIAFRWLTGEGTIRLGDLRSGGTAWLSVGIPGAEVGNLRRRIVDPPEGGDGMPRVRIAASCSGFEAEISGEGSHRVEVPVEPAAGGCEVTFVPNFVMESPDQDLRSLVLEILAWSSAGS